MNSVQNYRNTMRQGKMDLSYRKVSKLTNRKRKSRTYVYVIKKVMC